MVKFRIVKDTSNEKYPEYVELYNKGVTVKEISEKLGVSEKKCYTFYRYALSDGLIEPRRTNKNKKTKIFKAKYYSYKAGLGYNVYSPSANGKKTDFGYFQTEKEAKFIVEELKKVNWNKKYIDEIRLKAKDIFDNTGEKS